MIDAELRRIIDETYQRVMTVLLRRRESMSAIAHELIAKETLDREEIDRLLERVEQANPVRSLQRAK